MAASKGSSAPQQGPSPLHTVHQDLLAWLRQDPSWRDLPPTQRLGLAWRSFWATWNRRLSDAQLAEAPALAPPLFIVGPWRSGTTVMHELLAAATGWPTPQTWQCMNASSFQLLPAPPDHVRRTRPMDGLEISARSPQEDEFALLCMGVDSAYRTFLQPHRCGELRHTLDPAYWLDSASAWLPRFEHFLQGVLASDKRPGQRLLLKSPNHSFRLPALLSRFPNAQVVWMLRDAPSVLHSNRKMWRQMIEEHHVGSTGWSTEAIDGFLGDALQSCAQVLSSVASKAGTTPRLITCWQEDLALQPREAVQRVLDQLGLKLEHPEALEAALSRVAHGRIDRYDAAIPPAAAHGVDALQQAQQAFR